MKRSYLMIGFLAISSILLFVSALNSTLQRDDFLEKRAVLVIRKVGHLLLLQVGDSSSRILPVKQMASGIFQLEFQSEFSFKPDTLVKIIRENLSANNLPINYVVSVFSCLSNEMVYGFEINPSTNNLISCIGRTQPKGCYSIQIAFIDFGPKNESKPVIYQYGSGIIFISLIAFVGYGYLKGKKTNLVKKNNYIRLGSFILFKDQRLLKNDVAIIELSNKESKLLAVVA